MFVKIGCNEEGLNNIWLVVAGIILTLILILLVINHEICISKRIIIDNNLTKNISDVFHKSETI
jgi:hypothetical protein